ncbi:hypothetical protein HMSSN139_28320 [Paenibacillus sp. HMSSN-139]|nr:hypothetical protein HMSSN139_28320 [Paenibacillus sp. HMSSN-139]
MLERSKATQLNNEDIDKKPLDFYEFNGNLNTNGGITYMPFDQWERFLTDSQKEFIYEKSGTNPMRIQGPAGTGKTFKPDIKSQFIYYGKRKKKGEECKIIFFSHSKATQTSVKNIFNSISQLKWSGKDAGMARSIDITTLHEYCIDKLLTSQVSESEILERDALDSKNLQYYAVHESYEKVMKESFTTYKPLLSKSLLSILEGNPDNNSIICGLFTT